MKRKKNDYRAFLKKSGFKAREGKQVYISKYTHDKIAMLVGGLGNGEVTIADFTENVVSEFLRTHRDELYRSVATSGFCSCCFTTASWKRSSFASSAILPGYGVLWILR